MSLRIDSTEWISGSLLIGEAGLGVLGSAIPSTGDSGGSYLYNDLTLPADANKEICGRITTWPTSGTLTAYEDGSFSFTGPDASYSFAYQLYVDGVATGAPATVSLIVGGAALSIAASQATADASGYAATVNRQLDIAATPASATAAGYLADIQVGNDLSISAGQATAAGSGSTANVNRQLVIAASQATATARGFDASISNGAVIAASYGLASADGHQAQVNLRREIAAGVAAADATGYAANIGLGGGGAVWPMAAQVLFGIAYGPTGTEYTGTLTGGVGPSAADIAAAVWAHTQ